MNEVIFQMEFLHRTLVITPWKLIGYGGVAVFAGRWFVQVLASHRAGRSHLPRLFWHMSLLGSLLLLSYFSLSDKNDSVGVLSNLFPAAIAGYNLMLEARQHRRQARPDDAERGSAGSRGEVGTDGMATLCTHPNFAENSAVVPGIHAGLTSSAKLPPDTNHEYCSRVIGP